MGVKKPPYQAAEINPHWRSNTEWHVSVAQWRIFFLFFFLGVGGTNCSFSLKENQMRGIISEESPPLTRPFGFDGLFAKTPPCFLLVLFLNHLAFFFFTFHLPSACLFFLRREFAQWMYSTLSNWNVKKEAYKVWQESDFRICSSLFSLDSPTLPPNVPPKVSGDQSRICSQLFTIELIDLISFSSC